jgi:hypothetical protein
MGHNTPNMGGCQTGIGSCLTYSVVPFIETLASVFSKEHILVLPVLRGVSDIDGIFLCLEKCPIDRSFIKGLRCGAQHNLTDRDKEIEYRVI